MGPATLGGGGLGCPLAGFPPTQGNIVFCLVLLNYMTSRLCFLCLDRPVEGGYQSAFSSHCSDRHCFLF